MYAVLSSARLEGFLAVRNLFRQLRRSLSALLTISAGVMALLLADGYTAGMFSEFRESAIRAEYGHFQLTQPGFHERGRSDLDAYSMNAVPSSILDALPEGSVVAPRFLLTGLVSSGDTTLPFSGVGIDPAHDAQGGRALRLVSGSRLAADATDQVLVGEGLATQLGVSGGDEIILLVTTVDDQLNAREVRVAAVVAASSSAAGDALLILPITLARSLRRSDGAHQFLFFVPRDQDLRATEEIIEPLARKSALELRNWLSLADFYRKAESLFRQQLLVVLLIVAAILLLSISNTMMMSVMERTREIGTQMALGTASGRILRGFLLEGALLGALGVAIGVSVAFFIALLLDAAAIDMPPPPGFSLGYTARIEIVGASVLKIGLISWSVSVIASVYPAWRASRLKIVDSLRVVR